MKAYASAILLSGGRSARMGTPKGLLRYGGATFLERHLRSLAFCREALVITGVWHSRINEFIASMRTPPGSDSDYPFSYRALFNPEHDQGMFSSILTGVNALSPAADLVIIMPVDVPPLKRTLMLELCDALRASDASALVPTHRGEPGHPVLLNSSLLPKLNAATGTLRDFIKELGHRLARHEVPTSLILQNINTPTDLEALTGASPSHRVDLIGSKQTTMEISDEHTSHQKTLRQIEQSGGPDGGPDNTGLNSTGFNSMGFNDTGLNTRFNTGSNNKGGIHE